MRWRGIGSLVVTGRGEKHVTSLNFSSLQLEI